MAFAEEPRREAMPNLNLTFGICGGAAAGELEDPPNIVLELEDPPNAGVDNKSAKPFILLYFKSRGKCIPENSGLNFRYRSIFGAHLRRI